jgi:decaprenylphospho-beta-D-erythro-pentofuranosid-2-ulose 2-reductase
MSTVLILGATSDMGFAIARKYASENHSIQLAGRNEAQLKPLQSDLQIRYNIGCSVHVFDAMDLASHQAFYASLPVKPDITICVVGFMGDNEKVIVDAAATQQTIVTNFSGPVSILNIIAEDYTARKQGTIVGISSVAGLRGRQSNYIYGSAKAGFTAYLSGLRNKLFHSNVHVVTVLPGFVYTKMTAHLTLPKPLTAHPEEVATAIYEAVRKKKNVIYVKWFWRWIMKIITSIPESMFKKKKL